MDVANSLPSPAAHPSPLDDLGDYSTSEPLRLEAEAVRRKKLPETHPDYASSMNNLGFFYKTIGEFQRAEQYYRRALAIRHQVYGEEHRQYATSLSNLAVLYDEQGRFDAAEPLHWRAREIRQKVLGTKDPDYAHSLNNLGTFYAALGDLAQAEALLRECLEVTRQAVGDKHPSYATCLHNLAAVCDRQDRNQQAEQLYQEALKLTEASVGTAHPAYASSLSNLAGLYVELRQYERAEPLLQQVIEVRRKALGEQHADYMIGVNNLAALQYVRGEYPKAVALATQVSELWRKALGENHPSYATSLKNLAAVYDAMGEATRAAELSRQGLAISRAHMGLTFAVQSERQQLLLAEDYRQDLHYHLSLAGRAQLAAEEVYAAVLAWKGAVFARQQHMRLAQADPQLQPLFGDLQSAVSRLATLAIRVPEPKQRETWARQLAELTQQKERIEAELARRSAPYRAECEQTQLTADALRASLPSGVTLVDFLEYLHNDLPKTPGERRGASLHTVAFVIRAGSPVRRVDLGPAAPIHAAMAQWRAALAPDTPAGSTQASAAQALRRLIWEPLEPHLGGPRTVLISPDGMLARFPFAALPGKKPGTYLIEELSVGLIPVPRLLPELLAARSPDPAAANLLAVGGVDYDQSEEPAAPAAAQPAGPALALRGHRNTFKRLNETESEVLRVQRSFRKGHPTGAVQELTDQSATEKAFLESAPKQRFIHLATHGFFEPEDTGVTAPDPSVLSIGPGLPQVRRHPGLFAGIALAGANRPATMGRDDGVLTALELAAIDLRRAELIVLSACETGLGATAGGEGVFGLQRACQVAGARSVVASLWQVSDLDAAAVMTRFYRNLWEAKTGISTLEALRQAQLDVLRGAASRGIGAAAKTADEQQYRAPPQAWAAWVLAGDWR